jgi:hypothetical protein
MHTDKDAEADIGQREQENRQAGRQTQDRKSQAGRQTGRQTVTEAK